MSRRKTALDCPNHEDKSWCQMSKWAVSARWSRCRTRKIWSKVSSSNRQIPWNKTEGNKWDSKKKGVKWRVEICQIDSQIVTPRHTHSRQRTITYSQPRTVNTKHSIIKNIDYKWRRQCKHKHKTGHITTTTRETMQQIQIMSMVIRIWCQWMIEGTTINSKDRTAIEIVHMTIHQIMQSHVLRRVLEWKGRGLMQARKAIIVSWACPRRRPAVNQITKMESDPTIHLIKTRVAIRS